MGWKLLYADLSFFSPFSVVFSPCCGVLCWVTCDLCLLRICCREQPKTSCFETEGFPNTFWSRELLRAGPQEHGSCFSYAGRRTLVEADGIWNFDGWATTRWFREDIHNITRLDGFSYVLRLKLKYIQYLFGVKVTGISYQHNRGWPVTAQCLYPGGGWCHGFAMAWGAAPRSWKYQDFPWKHVRTKLHNLAVTWRSSNAWLRYVSWEGMISGYGDNSCQISVGTIYIIISNTLSYDILRQLIPFHFQCYTNPIESSWVLDTMSLRNSSSFQSPKASKELLFSCRWAGSFLQPPAPTRLW